ncbi:MAG: single-stranded DNA-binding protein [Oscillospiraceae bacterium]
MLNQVVLMGRLTANPELKHTPANLPVTSFTLAVARLYSKPGMERQTDFVDVVAWRNTAKFVCKYFVKGQMMAIDGSIRTGTYTDKEGKKRKKFEVLAKGVYFTESNKSGDSARNDTASTSQGVDVSDGACDFAVIGNDGDFPF